MYFSNRFRSEILVYIEYFDKQEGSVLFDFIDSNEFDQFSVLNNSDPGRFSPSMILVENYHGKNIRENTIYAISSETFSALIQERRISPFLTQDIKNEAEGSLIIAYVIDLWDFPGELFKMSVALNEEEKWERNIFQSEGYADYGIIPSTLPHDTRAVIRDVGQGNWNELWVSNSLLLIFDAGAPMRSTRSEVKHIIRDREQKIIESRPGLLISHWDVDHYHSLIGMDDATLRSFAYVVCRDHLPTLTSRIIFGRLRNPGVVRVLSVPTEGKSKLRSTVPLRLKSSHDSGILLFNACAHKDRNKSGILLAARTHDSSIIFPGDAHYYQISDYVLPHLDYNHKHHLVVPHHGGEAGRFKYDFRRIKPESAVVSVGLNSYHHPDAKNITALSNLQFHVTQTRFKKQDIVIPL